MTVPSSARRSRPRSIGPRYSGHFGHLMAQTASARSSSSGSRVAPRSSRRARRARRDGMVSLGGGSIADRLGRRLRVVGVVRVEQMRRHRRAVVGEILPAHPGRVVFRHLLDVGLETFRQVDLPERHFRLLREPLLVGHVVAGDDQLLDALQRPVHHLRAQARMLDHPQQRAAQRFVGRIGLDHRHVGEPRIGVGLGRWRRVGRRRAGRQRAAERRCR